MIQTYFGDVRDVYNDLVNLPVDGIGLDFVEGKKTLELVKGGFQLIRLFMQVLSMGRTSGATTMKKSLEILDQVPAEKVDLDDFLLPSSCAIYNNGNEDFEPAILNHFAFAVEKLGGLRDLDAIRNGQGAEALAANKELFATERVGANAELHARIAALTEADYTRLPAFAEREEIQKSLQASSASNNYHRFIPSN